MGLNTSKFNHNVRKVTPLESQDVYVSPANISGLNRQNRFPSIERLDQRSPTCGRQLPPLRETLYGRGSTAPKPISFDIPLEDGDTNSIIKRHPPRRLQRLEPIVLPTIMSAEQIVNKQEAVTARKGKVGARQFNANDHDEMEKKVQTAKRSAARRQHIHKMQMQEINRKREEINNLQAQAELKRNIHREAKINKHKMKEIKARKTRENALKSNEDDEFLTVEHDKTFNVDDGDAWHWNITDPHNSSECRMQKNGKLEMWFKDFQGGHNMYSDSSSSDSLDSLIREDTMRHHRPALIRTKTEKIPTFDEFFDDEL
ncbi:factor associated with metabolism and energy [Rhinophrynus dorsalis]